MIIHTDLITRKLLADFVISTGTRLFMENTPLRKSEPLTSSAYRELYFCDNVL